VSSRYMDATASSRLAATASVYSGKKPTATVQEKVSKSSSPVRRRTKSSTTQSTHLNQMHALHEPSTAKNPTAISDSYNRREAFRGLGSSFKPLLCVKTKTAFELEIASQLYPWIFMRHTLTESSNTAIAEFQAGQHYVIILSSLTSELGKICCSCQRTCGGGRIVGGQSETLSSRKGDAVAE
jgi:hypothetical protein